MKLKHQILILILILLIFTNYFCQNTNNDKPSINYKQYIWETEIRPNIDHFISLIQHNNFDNLYSQFVKTEYFDQSEFESQFTKLSNIYGNVINYKFLRSSASKYNDKYNGFYIFYWIEFSSGFTADAVFSIKINDEKNRPYDNYIDRLIIKRNVNIQNDFYIFVNEPIQDF